MNMKRRFLLLLVSFLCTLSLCSCGEKGSKLKDYAGYYTYFKEVPYDYSDSEAIEISKDGKVVYKVHRLTSVSRIGTTYGTLNVKDNKGYFYNAGFEGDEKINWSKCFPLYLTLIDDGDALYVESDNENWIPDSYVRVDKKSYDAFCAEAGFTENEQEEVE